MTSSRHIASRLSYNFDSVLLWSTVASCVVASSNPALVCAGLVSVVIVGTVLWLRRRTDAYVLGSLAYLALPYVYGQWFLSNGLSPVVQTLVGLVSVIGLTAYSLVRYVPASRESDWPAAQSTVFLVGLVAVLGWSAYAGPVWCLSASLVAGLLCLVLAERIKAHDWVDVTALILFLPLLRSYPDKPVLLLTTVVVLAILTGLSLRYRRETLRWGATLVWSALPVSIGLNNVGGEWSAAMYAWAYFVVTLCLLLCRAIARGVVLVSDTIPLTAYARSASLSYVFGYVTTASFSIIISLDSADSRLHTSLLLAAYLGLAALVAFVIEKRPLLLALLPFLAQGLLLSVLRPTLDSQSFVGYLLLSSILAASIYAYSAKDSDKTITTAALLTSFIAPAAVLVTGRSVWAMAAGLLIAGLLTNNYVRYRPQADREAAGLIITAAILWSLGVAGVSQVQAYVHVIVLNLALYAYWRYIRNDMAAVDQYIWGTLSVATVPLALQAIGGQSGGLYGWWLLLEMIVIMLIGMAIRRRFVIMWGLYVTVGAVLYQLRDLGWAALTVLALFLIGLAVYQLQKHDKQR